MARRPETLLPSLRGADGRVRSPDDRFRRAARRFLGARIVRESALGFGCLSNCQCEPVNFHRSQLLVSTLQSPGGLCRNSHILLCYRFSYGWGLTPVAKQAGDKASEWGRKGDKRNSKAMSPLKARTDPCSPSRSQRGHSLSLDHSALFPAWMKNDPK